MTKVDNEHGQLVTMLNQLMDEREVLYRENEYLKAKLNESVLMETINDMKKERDALLKLLNNLTMNKSREEQLRYIKQHLKENNTDPPPSSYSTFNGKSVDQNNSSFKQNSTLLHHNPSSTINHSRIHRIKTNIEHQPTVIYRIENNHSNRLSSPTITHIKYSQPNNKFVVYKPSTAPQTQEFNKLIRKQDIQLKHSQNSPFKQYRSQSLQDLT